MDAAMDEMDAIDQELAAIDKQIADLQYRRSELEEYRDALLASLSGGDDPGLTTTKEQAPVEKEYNCENFAWSSDLRELAKKHWNIDQWRDKQLAVMNASLDQRDTFVLMPTGNQTLTIQHQQE
jgi:ATP-dependent DNA helicase Q1